MAKVMLVHATRPGADMPTPHGGCAQLAGVLRQQGHQARIIDYACLPPHERTWDGVARIVEAFDPDVIGFSIYTASSSLALDLARRCKDRFAVPIIVGGAHATVYPERVAANRFVDTVVTGEAENVIGRIASDPASLAGKIVRGEPADVSALPFPDFTALYRSDLLRIYPLLLSRGCPFGCSFCPVHLLLGRNWRARPLDAVARELQQARQTFPQATRIEVHDDCPTGDVGRFKSFLRDFPRIAPGTMLHVANMRADTVDQEMIDLLKAAGTQSACIAAEHGNPEVFAAIGKGESLEDIERAGRLIRQAGLGLQVCFVIGLPGDSLKRTRDSVRLAKRLDPYLVYWNMAHPFPGTRMWQWFEQNGGTFYPDDDYCSYSEPTFDCDDPVVETPGFTRRQRKAAKFYAAVATDQYDLRREGWAKLMRLTAKYGHIWSVIKSLIRTRVGKRRKY